MKQRTVVIRLAVTVVLLLVMVLYINPQETFDTLQNADWRLLMLATVLTIPLITTRILRWYFLAKLDIAVDANDIVVSYLLGLALSTFTPAGLGETGRAAFLKNADGKRASLSGRVLLDKLTDLHLLIWLASLGLLLSGQQLLMGVGGLIVVLVGVADGAILLMRHRMATIQFKQAIIQNIFQGITQTPLSILVINHIIGLVGMILLYGQLFVVLRAFDAEVPVASIVFYPLITLSTLLPITLNGLGIRELTAVFLLQRYDLTEAVIFNGVFLHFFIATIPPILLGLFLWWGQPRRVSSTEH